MFQFIDWVLDKIAPIGRSTEPDHDSEGHWQHAIVEELAHGYRSQSQEPNFRAIDRGSQKDGA